MSRIPRLQAGSRRQRILHAQLIGLAVTALLLLLRTTDLFESIELGFVDLRTRHYAGDLEPDPDIVIVQIEESDIDWVRKEWATTWPWPLEYNAYLMRVLKDAGARAVMLDILHVDRGAGPDDVPGDRKLTQVQRQTRENEARDAQDYGAALGEYGKAAVAFELTNGPTYELPARRTLAVKRLGGEEIDGVPGDPLVRSGADLPILGVTGGATLLGFSNTTADLDGVIRRSTVVGRWGDRTVLSLPMATLLVSGHRSSHEAPFGSVPGVQAVDDDGSFVVAFRAPRTKSPYTRIEPARVLAWATQRDEKGALPAEAGKALEGKIVVLGINAVGATDVVSTPLGVMDGPAFQATVLDNLLNGGGRTRAGWGEGLLWLLIATAAFGSLGAAFEARWTPHLIALAGAAALLFAGFSTFDAGRSHDLFTPLLGIVLGWGGTTALRAMTAGRRNKWLEGTFGRYMAPSIIEALKKDPALLALGGRQTEITVLFSDVANFTSHSAKLEARQLVELLNRYLTGHCAAVMAEGGVVDKFEGDAVMAFFGDPVPQEDHAARACRSALGVIEDLPSLQPVWKGMGLDEFRIRVGLNTGEAVVGNMGSDQRFDYTCMGDTVNLASRIEGAGKIYGTQILVGQATAEAAEETCLFKPLGALVVIGREEPVGVFELLATNDAADETLRAHVRAFGKALAALKQDDLDAAEAHLADAEAARAGDGPCAWLRGVVAALRDGAIERPWSGVTRQSAK